MAILARVYQYIMHAFDGTDIRWTAVLSLLVGLIIVTSQVVALLTRNNSSHQVWQRVFIIIGGLTVAFTGSFFSFILCMNMTLDMWRQQPVLS